ERERAPTFSSGLSSLLNWSSAHNSHKGCALNPHLTPRDSLDDACAVLRIG
ncbi:hypothetical protein BaRGS_00017616, partial [Batillaria attramentaria]